ncbi:hypothetical protein SAMN03159318_03291 [Pseudomonas sp. NFACC42-2]|jgi:catechol 2,3-dioxygenase-like lactoylglutathione lyase family enzyme|nr:hypothetical protein [Pseudomonas sp. NFACC42-2]SFS27005.1 hypothetical protein SAMN03159318_03291 [Pseudomonas sp. NFACC42-2]
MLDHLFLSVSDIPRSVGFYAAALAHGARDNGAPGARLHYDPDYYAANVLDPDGYSLEFVYKNWQHSL